jgi:hypothetical protein
VFAPWSRDGNTSMTLHRNPWTCAVSPAGEIFTSAAVPLIIATDHLGGMFTFLREPAKGFVAILIVAWLRPPTPGSLQALRRCTAVVDAAGYCFL